jgi:hypothetical protein
VPEVELLAPADGYRVPSGVLVVAFRCTCRAKIARGCILFSDYLAASLAYEFDPQKHLAIEDRYWIRFPLALIGSASGRVLGICVALQTEGGVPKIGYSQVVNVLLPEQPEWLASDALEAEYTEDFSEVDPEDWDPEDAEYDEGEEAQEAYDDLAWLEGEGWDAVMADGEVGWGQEGLRRGDGQEDGEGSGVSAAGGRPGSGPGKAVGPGMGSRGRGGRGTGGGRGRSGRPRGAPARGGQRMNASARSGSGGDAAPVRSTSLLKGLPSEPPPPRYEEQKVTTTVGRRIEAKRVQSREKEEPPKPPRTKVGADLTPGNRQMVKKARALAKDLPRGTQRSGPARRTPLSASELEKRIARYAENVEKLTPDERRVVEEYYRYLRDLE